MKLHGRTLVKGKASGELLATLQPISFLGGVDPDTGVIRDQKHELYGISMTGKIFAVPNTVGSSVGAYVVYGMVRKGTSPAGIVADAADINLVTGCAAAGLPLLIGIDVKKLLSYEGKKALLDADSGYIEIKPD